MIIIKDNGEVEEYKGDKPEPERLIRKGTLELFELDEIYNYMIRWSKECPTPPTPPQAS
jgi:hypothetical protein